MNKKEKIMYAVEELIGKGNLKIIHQTFATDYIAYAGEKEYSGHAFIKRFAKELRTSFPDLHVVDVQFLAENEDTVSWLRILEGTNKTAMRGIPASGKNVKWMEIVVSRFQDEKIVEEWVVSELMGELLLKVPRLKK